MFRITHTPTGFEGEGKTLQDAFKALVYNPKYKAWQSGQFTKRGSKTGRTLGDLVYSDDSIMSRWTSILRLGKESGVLRVESI